MAECESTSPPLLVRACRCEPVPRCPVWIMRQAGRFLPEYQAVRARHGFVEVCMTPDLAAEVTLQPVRRLDVDAAIIFHDILLLLRPMGAGFDFTDKPVLDRPIRTREQIAAIHPPQSQQPFAYLHEALRRTREQLPPEKALIGFAGAPFTLANYLIEGGGSHDSLETKKLLMTQPDLLQSLLRTLTDATIEFLIGQINAGAQVLQIFESSGGLLGPDDYAEFALPHVKRIIASLKPFNIPIILFPRGCGAYLELFADCGAHVIGIDWQTPLRTARGRLAEKTAIQGNIDPVALLGPRQLIEGKVAQIIDEMDNLRGFIFNLGHGILPSTPPENALIYVQAAKSLSERQIARRMAPPRQDEP